MTSVQLVPWRATWARMFDAERDRLAAVFGGVDHTIEHIGSTSVVGLAAKPIIDVMVGVETLEDVEARISALEALGFEYVPGYESEIPDRRYFRRPHARPRTFHVHCVQRGGRLWRRHLAFRDYLRERPEGAHEYQLLKQRLAATHPSDRTAYQEGKAPFICAILEEIES